MVEKRQCQHCHKDFPLRPQNPNQHYCSKQDCQRARKRLCQRQKRRDDAEYRANQAAAHDAWEARNPLYWQEYREAHPDYVMRNRLLQRERNRRRRGQESGQPVIANMDASTPGKPLCTGRYQLRMLVANGSDLIANMDASIVELVLISSS